MDGRRLGHVVLPLPALLGAQQRGQLCQIARICPTFLWTNAQLFCLNAVFNYKGFVLVSELVRRHGDAPCPQGAAPSCWVPACSPGPEVAAPPCPPFDFKAPKACCRERSVLVLIGLGHGQSCSAPASGRQISERQCQTLLV